MESRMKIVAAAALMSVLAMGSARAEGEEAEVSASLDVPVLSAYVWRGLVLNDEAVVQPTLTVAKGGFAINWWGNYNLTDNVTGDEYEFSEHDISLSYSAVCPLTGAGMTIGVVNYDFPNPLVDGDGNATLVADTAEIYLIAAFTDVLLSPTLSVYYDTKEADGFYGSLGISHSLELSEQASLNLAASLGAASEDWGSYYYGVEDYDDGLNDWSVSASIPFAVNDSWTVTPGVSYTALLGDSEDSIDATGFYFGEDDHVVGSLKASYAF